SLRQLKQRVALRCELGALDARETAEYIAGRIRIAGGNSALVFTRQAVDAVYERSTGIPRLISVICDNALISAFAADRRPVSRASVEEVCGDFDLAEKAETKPQPPEVRRQEQPVTQAASASPSGASQEPRSPAPHRRSLFEHFSVRRRFSVF